jgi:hypothetical protein
VRSTAKNPLSVDTGFLSHLRRDRNDNCASHKLRLRAYFHRLSKFLYASYDGRGLRSASVSP